MQEKVLKRRRMQMKAMRNGKGGVICDDDNGALV